MWLLYLLYPLLSILFVILITIKYNNLNKDTANFSDKLPGNIAILVAVMLPIIYFLII